MFALGLQGSPRLNGNTSIMLKTFLNEIKILGGYTEYINVSNKKIYPCHECGICERTGFCNIKDDMKYIYSKIKESDIIIAATPIFFYGPTAQLKTLIDRTQALWVRKYRHNLSDPGSKWRKGIFMGIGATKGKNLFDGTILSIRYFFDACGAKFLDSITIRSIENSGDINKREDILNSIKNLAKDIYINNRKKILFLCRENSFRSQIAYSIMRRYFGDKYWVMSAGDNPSTRINPLAIKILEEEGIDMNYIYPKSLTNIPEKFIPDIIVIMGCDISCASIKASQIITWDIEQISTRDIRRVREIKERIKEKIIHLHNKLSI